MAEHLEDVAAGGIGQCAKHTVEDRVLILNHKVKY